MKTVLALRAAEIPAAAGLAIDLVAGWRHRDGVLQLDEAALWMLHRGLDRHHHARFERLVRVIVVIGHRSRGGQARGFVADQTHAMGQKFGMVALADLREPFLGGSIDVSAHRTGPDGSKRGLLDSLDLGETI